MYCINVNILLIVYTCTAYAQHPTYEYTSITPTPWRARSAGRKEANFGTLVFNSQLHCSYYSTVGIFAYAYIIPGTALSCESLGATYRSSPACSTERRTTSQLRVSLPCTIQPYFLYNRLVAQSLPVQQQYPLTNHPSHETPQLVKGHAYYYRST